MHRRGAQPRLAHYPDLITRITYQSGSNPRLFCTANDYLGREQMDTWYYEVISIDGDYANLKRTDIDSDDIKLVARALLPDEIYVGCHLKYEMMQYDIE